MSKPISHDVLISSRLYAELIWLHGLVKDGLWYFPDFIKKVIPINCKSDDIKKAHALAASIIKYDSKELITQAACHILLQGNYKGIDKSRLLTANAQNRCKAILFALTNIVKTEDNKANILWPRLDLIKKKLGCFDFERLPGLGIIQFKSADYLKACCQPVMPIIDKLTIYDLLTPLTDEQLNNTRRCMLFTLNSVMLTKALEKPVLGVPYMEFLKNEFDERLRNKIVEKESEIIPTPEGLEFHILSLNSRIKTLKRENKDLLSTIKAKSTETPISMTPDDVAAQIQLFVTENDKLKERILELEQSYLDMNKSENTLVQLSLELLKKKKDLNEVTSLLGDSKNEVNILKTKLDEQKSLLILAQDERKSALNSVKHNSELSTALQNQVNIGMSKYRDLQQRYESTIEQLALKDKKILHLSEEAGKLVNTTYITHLDAEVKRLKSAISVATVDGTTVEDIEDARLELYKDYMPTIKLALQEKRNAAINYQKRKPYEIEPEEELSSTITNDEVDEATTLKIQQMKIYKLSQKCAGIITGYKTIHAYESLNKELLAERLKNEALGIALLELKKENVTSAFEGVLTDFSERQKKKK